MSDQEINIAIAEARGLKWHAPPLTGHMGYWQLGDKLPHGGWCNTKEEGAPDYCNDLNAMREAEELFELSAKFGAHDYAATLYHICVPRDMQHDDHFICWVVAFYLLNATARQRAEAFLRTIGKWKEAK